MMDVPNSRVNRAKSRQSIAHVPTSSRSDATDKQNATIDLSATRFGTERIVQLQKKRTRGKSLGPGGIEALKESDGNATKIASIFQPKSILKPAIPLTPPKSIPTFEELRQRSTKKKSPAKHNIEALLIDFSTPGPSRDNVAISSTMFPQTFDPFSPLKPMNPAQIAVNHNVENGDTEERLRQEQKKTILEQRAARRKSLANRRVSFAPEATLHTWSVMEMIEDSTTSSTSNSTRRQSTLMAHPNPETAVSSAGQNSEVSGLPSASDVQAEELLVKSSPAYQKNARRQGRRRSSAVSEEGDASSDDAYSSSPSGDVMAESSPIRVEESIHSDSDTDGDTAMSIDDMTQNTVHSQESGSSTRSSLEERLRQAASQAGTRGIQYDEFGDDVSMEIADDTVTNAFQPWAQNRQQQSAPTHDQENINPFSPSKKAADVHATNRPSEEDTTQGITMEMTRAVGGILFDASSPQKSHRKSIVSGKRSSLGRRQSLAADSSYGDESMDLTTVAGGILSANFQDALEGDNNASDEEITMEFTTAAGFVHDRKQHESFESSIMDGNETMDMTVAVGGILAPIEEQTEPQSMLDDEVTMAMEMTKAVGHILSNGVNHDVPQHANQSVNGDINRSITVDNGSSLQVDEQLIASTPKQLTSIASETGSPSLALKTRSSARVRSARSGQTSTPASPTRSTPQKVSSIKKQVTPTKQMTPVPTRAKTPERTPVSVRIPKSGVSPKRLFQAEIQAKSSPASNKKPAAKSSDLLFAQDELTGRHTPRVVLHAPKPHQHLRRRSSGIGIDKNGSGSPSVTQLLSRRSSIGDAAPRFKLESGQASRLRFENPRQIAAEVDAERAQEERRESGRFLMEQEANEPQEENTTSQLKDMIESMTPKKNKIAKLKGRKSLAVGSARGVLGKRPAELDEDAEDIDTTPKRLKAVSREGSPVKKIHLPKPPSKEETTGRLTRAERHMLDITTDTARTPTIGVSPSRPSTVQTPQQSQRYRNVAQGTTSERPTSFEEKLDNVVGAIDPAIEHSVDQQASEEDRISLQQFLNMTNIHFIELNTTKRRQTLAQIPPNNSSNGVDQESKSTKTCFTAAATTLPLLELYQHATRELKSYISTGRKIIRSIEAETLAEQPALFREYLEARPDVKLVMDNQFRNGKTNARLQSKEGWYTWRSQLVDGLQNGLKGVQDDITKDLIVVRSQKEALAQTTPELIGHRDGLTHELRVLQQKSKMIQSVDHHELKASRRTLKTIDADLHKKLATLRSLQQQMQEKDEALSQAAELKEEMQEQIGEADRVREEHRGWTANEVLTLKSNVEAIRKISGWSLVSAEEDLDDPTEFGVALTMRYKDALRLFFYPSAYEQPFDGTHHRSGLNSQSVTGPTAPISLTYVPARDSDKRVPELPTEQRFFLQMIQSHLHAFSMTTKSSVSTKTILQTTASGWELACKTSQEVRSLSLAGITRVSIKSDEELLVKLTLMTVDKSRVDIEFVLTVMSSDNGGISIATSVTAQAIYGPVTKLLDVSKTRKVQTALNKEVENRTFGQCAWIKAVQGFEEWRHAQAKSQSETMNVLKPDVLAPQEDAVATGSTTPRSPAPARTKTPAVRRSPLATKKSTVMQKKTIPVPTARQDKFRTSQREQQPPTEKIQPPVHEAVKDKENLDPFAYSTAGKAPAITPEMQEVMMRTPIKRVGALRRSPV